MNDMGPVLTYSEYRNPNHVLHWSIKYDEFE